MKLIDQLLAEVKEDGKYPQVLTRDEVQERIWKLTERTGRTRRNDTGKWKDRWVPSLYFRLMRIRVDEIEQPIRPHSSEIVEKKIGTTDPEPIFIDRNKHRYYGKHERLKKTETYVIDGKHRAEAARRKNRKTILAYVGDQAVDHFARHGKGRWWSDEELKKLQ